MGQYPRYRDPLGQHHHQEVVEGTLATIAQKAREAKIGSPAMVIIGRVVSLRKKLRWFDTKTLFGKKIVITRALDQAPEFTRLLEEHGAEVISFPTIQILPPKTWTGWIKRSLRCRAMTGSCSPASTA